MPARSRILLAAPALVLLATLSGCGSTPDEAFAASLEATGNSAAFGADEASRIASAQKICEALKAGTSKDMIKGVAVGKGLSEANADIMIEAANEAYCPDAG